MKRLALFLLLAGSTAQAAQVRLRDPQYPTLTATSVTASTPPVITFDTAHNLTAGTTIHCIGFAGQPTANGLLLVKTVPTSTSISVTDTNGVDIMGRASTNTDFDTRISGNQVGYCGRVSIFDTTGAGWFPLTGPATNYFKDPDGAGAAVAPNVTNDPTAWSFLSNICTNNTTATCDGDTPALCTTEDSVLDNNSNQINEGWPALNCAVGWFSDNSKTQWLNSARYFLNHLERVAASDQRDYFAPCDEAAVHCGQGEVNNNASFFLGTWAQIYALIKDHLSTAEKDAVAAKIFNDETTSCVDSMPDPSGGVTVLASSNVARGSGFNSYTVGRKIYVKQNYRVYKINDASLVSINVASNLATATLISSAPVPAASTYIRVANSSVSGLDGWYQTASTIGTSTFSFTTSGVADGNYTTAGMTIDAPGTVPSDGCWRQITSIQSDTEMTLGSAAPGCSVAYFNSPLSYPTTGFRDNQCGAFWFSNHHANAPTQKGARWGTLSSIVNLNDTSMVFNTGTYDNFKDLTPPFEIGAGSELMQVTALDQPTRTLTISRALHKSRQARHLTSAIFGYFPTGAYLGFGGSAITRSLAGYYSNLPNRAVGGFISAAAPLANDYASARRWLEYYWNYFIDNTREKNRLQMAGLTNSGPASPGYYYGSWIDIMSWVALFGKHSFTPVMDLITGFPGHEKAYETMIHLTRADTVTRHLTWSDSGSVRYFESDDLKGYEMSPYLFTSSAPVLTNFVRTLNSNNIETAPYRLVFSSSPQTSYHTLPTKRVFNFTPDGLPANFMMGGVSFRQDWTTSTGTVGFFLITPGDDHNANYPFPGGLMLTKGQSEFICGTTVGCATFNDARNVEGVEIYTSATASNGGQAAGSTYTPSNGAAYMDRMAVGTDYAYARTINKRYATTINATSVHREAVYLDPGNGGQDYVMIYDHLITPAGRTKVRWIPFYKATSDDPVAGQSPAVTFSRTGQSIDLISNMYGTRLHTKLLTPTTTQATYTDETTGTYANRVSISTNADNAEFLTMFQPCGNTTCAESSAELIVSSSSHLVTQLSDGTTTWIVGMTRVLNADIDTFYYTATSYSGTGKHIIVGLPSATYDVYLDGNLIVNDTVVGSDGVLRFDSAYGTGGQFSITNVGGIPLDIIGTIPTTCESGSAYTTNLSAIGGTPPYTWSIVLGSLPTGITIFSTGSISGICSGAIETSTFTVQVQDDVAATDTQQYTIDVTTTPSTPLSIAPIADTECQVGSICSFTAVASGGATPYTYTTVNGTVLPEDMALNPSTGQSTGTITSAALGDHFVTIQAADAQAATVSAVAKIIVTVPAGGSDFTVPKTVCSQDSCLIDIRRGGLSAGTTVYGAIRQQSDDVEVGTFTFVMGPARRTIIVGNLIQNTDYNLSLSAGALYYNSTLSTKAEDAVGSTDIKVIVSKSSKSVADYVKVSYGTDTSVTSSSTTACTGTECGATVTSTEGPFYSQVYWCDNSNCDVIYARTPVKKGVAE